MKIRVDGKQNDCFTITLAQAMFIQAALITKVKDFDL